MRYQVFDSIAKAWRCLPPKEQHVRYHPPVVMLTVRISLSTLLVMMTRMLSIVFPILIKKSEKSAPKSSNVFKVVPVKINHDIKKEIMTSTIVRWKDNEEIIGQDCTHPYAWNMAL